MKLFPPLKEISITEIEGLRIGNAQDLDAMTGVTVYALMKVPKLAAISAAAARHPEKRLLPLLLLLIIPLMPLFFLVGLLLVWQPVTA